MRKLLLMALLTFSGIAFSQSKGTVKGLLTDKETNNDPLPFANVLLKGTSFGATSDMDGNYTISAPAGSYTIVFSFLGYKTVEKPVTIVAGKTTTINQEMTAEGGVALDEVQIKTTTSKEKESAILLEQKKATVIKESIGAERLSKVGVSDASGATTKISGVAKSEGTGDIYVRGLGDRYLSTTMNQLPIPSDDVSKKNINLNLFSTDVIKSVSISKTYDVFNFADQASGNVDVASKEYTRKQFIIGVSSGINTNVIDEFGNFRRTIISDDVTLGFHKKKYATVNLIDLQGWDTKKLNTPLNYSFSLSGGHKFDKVLDGLYVYATASHSKSHSHQKGIFKSYRSNVLDNGFSVNKVPDPSDPTKNIFIDVPDGAESYINTINTTGLLGLKLRINDNHTLKSTSLFVNKGVDNLYEQGRNGFGYVFDQDPQEEGAFVRDQNFKQTLMIVNQLMGEHKLSERNTLSWAGGYNYVLAEEPNRIRNEVNILNYPTPTIQFAHVGDYQQRKSRQKINDTELNGYIKDEILLGTPNEDEERPYKLNFGVSSRFKKRDFNSLFIGVRAKGLTAPSIDDISSVINTANFNNGSGLILRTRPEDKYNAKMFNAGAFISFDFNLSSNISGNIGLRYEEDRFDIDWDVANYVGRIGNLSKIYTNGFPSANVKFEVNEKSFIRVASSVTQTLPEFKELSPFEYVSPTGRVIKGNPNLKRSDIFNTDIKWEYFPSRGELLSFTTFYKKIDNPINLAQSRGSSGNYIFENTGKEANVFGVELEGRFNLIKNEDDQALLNLTGNLTKMWLKQDLLPNFQYKDKTESKLEGASDFIANAALSYTNRKENQFVATLSGNYSSDKIYALGSPESFANKDVFYNDEIIEKGFITLDLIMSKKFTKNLSVKLVGKNLLNPDIKQTQLIKNIITKKETNELVSSYKKGIQLSLGISYKF